MQTMKFIKFFFLKAETFLFLAETCFYFRISDARPQFLLRARRNEKELKVKPATSFNYFLYLLTKKIKTKLLTKKYHL